MIILEFPTVGELTTAVGKLISARQRTVGKYASSARQPTVGKLISARQRTVGKDAPSARRRTVGKLISARQRTVGKLISARQRTVGKQDRRIRDQLDADRQALPFAARDAANVVAANVGVGALADAEHLHRISRCHRYGI